MKYRINPAGNRIVEATPEETRALRPSIRAAFRRWRANEGDVEDFCQDVEIIVWQAIHEQRVPGDGFKRPEDALLNFMFAVAWNRWRNYSRRPQDRYEILAENPPEMASPCPVTSLEARDALRRIAARPWVAYALLLSLEGSRPERKTNMPRSTFWNHVAQARAQAREILAEHSRKPVQPVPPTPWKRKGKR